MPNNNQIKPGMFDVPYGVASADITTGLTIVATTGGNYHGASVVAGDTSASITARRARRRWMGQVRRG